MERKSLRTLPPVFGGNAGGEESLAKETMEAVSAAELEAQQMIAKARSDGEQLVADARSTAEKLLRDAQKEALKRVEVLKGVARADGQKLKARSLEETKEEQARLTELADRAFPQALASLRSILLGTAPEEGGRKA